LHPKQNIESDLKPQTCFGKVPSKVRCLSGKGLNYEHLLLVSSECLKQKPDKPGANSANQQQTKRSKSEYTAALLKTKSPAVFADENYCQILQKFFGT